MGRRPCCEKVGINKGPWTVEEDVKLTNFILNHGIHCWRIVPKLAGVRRCGKSCRLRWVNYLRPDIKRGAISEEEEDEIIRLHSLYGNRWSKIAAHFAGRTDNEIKNHWNTRIKKKLRKLELDHQTHRPIEDREKSETCSDQSTSSSTESDNFWQSFEMELTCSSSSTCQTKKFVQIQEEDVQNWICCLQSLLFKDALA